MTAPYRFAADTSAAASAVLVHRWRSMTPSEKAAQVVALNMAVRQSAIAGLKMRHPMATPNEIEQRLRRLCLGDELYECVYGSEPER